jgi:hypothetical protein
MDSKLKFPVNELREKCKEYIKRLNPDNFITLTFRENGVSENFAKNTLLKFLNMVNREIFGRYSNEKINIMVVQEKNESCGIHYHLLVCDPSDRTKRMEARNLRDICRDKWKKLRNAGFHDFDKLNDQWYKEIDDVDGMSDYVTKTIKSNTDPVDWELSNFSK